MLTVSAVPTERRREALTLLLREFSADERALRLHEWFDSHSPVPFPLEGLLMAQRDGEIIGVTMTVAQPDGTVFVWPPVVLSDNAGVTDALLEAARRRIAECGAWIGQAIVESERLDDREALIRGGFPHLADLEFLQRSCRIPLEAGTHSELHPVEYCEFINHARFAHVLERTYAATLDCPELSGLRTADQALMGHKLNGEFSPSRWRLYEHAGEDVGVLLMTQHDPCVWEVVYLGVVEAARGRGYGQAILLEGLQRASAAGVENVLLAVDTRNTCAKRLYHRLGFEYLARRSIHALLISTSS